jgi:hypothetical protein
MSTCSSSMLACRGIDDVPQVWEAWTIWRSDALHWVPLLRAQGHLRHCLAWTLTGWTRSTERAVMGGMSH